MTQLAEYVQLVDDLGFDGMTDAIKERAINLARQRVCRDGRWSFMQDLDQTLDTAADNPEVATTGIAAFLRPDAVRLLDGDDPIPLTWWPYQQLRDYQADQPDTGLPSFWSARDGALVFYPTPDQAYVVDLDKVFVPTDLSGATEDVIPEHLAALVQWAAAVDLLFRQRDYNGASSADRHYKETLLPVAYSQDKTYQRQSARRVRRTGTWGGI